MIEHVSLHVRDHGAAKEFYLLTLKPIGYEIRYEFDNATGFMEGGHTSFWIDRQMPGDPLHIAFRARSAESVQAFHAAGVGAGGKDNGAPGYRPDYSPDYYAAFIIDREGNNIEAVWYDPARKA